VSLVGTPRTAQRALRTELACARALLDALEAVLDAETREQVRADVVVQMADQLARMANAIKRWNARPSEKDCAEADHDKLLDSVGERESAA
jgi:hypothetical protein